MSKRPNLDEWYKNGALMDAVNADGLVLSDYWTRKAEARIIELLESLKGPTESCCEECRPHAARNRDYLTAVQELIQGRAE